MHDGDDDHHHNDDDNYDDDDCLVEVFIFNSFALNQQMDVLSQTHTYTKTCSAAQFQILALGGKDFLKILCT